MIDPLTTGAVVFKKNSSQIKWLLVREPNGEWELPKSPIRRGESSVGAAIRNQREDYGNLVQVLEEAGRANTLKAQNGQKINQKTIFYLAERKEDSMQTGKEFEEKWQIYANATRTLKLKRERDMLRQANRILKELNKKKKE